MAAQAICNGNCIKEKNGHHQPQAGIQRSHWWSSVERGQDSTAERLDIGRTGQADRYPAGKGLVGTHLGSKERAVADCTPFAINKIT